MKHGDDITLNITDGDKIVQSVNGILSIDNNGVVRMNGSINGGEKHQFFISNSVEAIFQATHFHIVNNSDRNMCIHVQELEFL